jgi:hypothetical protein
MSSVQNLADGPANTPLVEQVKILSTNLTDSKISTVIIKIILAIGVVTALAVAAKKYIDSNRNGLSEKRKVF